jgi:hypothetical protein
VTNVSVFIFIVAFKLAKFYVPCICFKIPLIVILIHNGEIRKEKEIKNVEFLPREMWIFGSKQNIYFAIIRHWSNKDLNPKTNFFNKHVSGGDLANVFGPKLILNFKLTNFALHIDTRKELKKLNWQIYGALQPTNKNYMLWVAKGYIT